MGHSCSGGFREDRGFSVGVTVAAPNGNTDYWGTKASDIQSGITIGTDAITGTLKYRSSGQIVTDWGAGYFLGLDFSGDAFSTASHIYVGLTPSAGSGLVDVINDPDRQGIFKITNKDEQAFTINVVDSNGVPDIKHYRLSGLTLQAAT